MIFLVVFWVMVFIMFVLFFLFYVGLYCLVCCKIFLDFIGFMLWLLKLVLDRKVGIFFDLVRFLLQGVDMNFLLVVEGGVILSGIVQFDFGLKLLYVLLLYIFDELFLLFFVVYGNFWVLMIGFGVLVGMWIFGNLI